MKFSVAAIVKPPKEETEHASLCRKLPRNDNSAEEGGGLVGNDYALTTQTQLDNSQFRGAGLT